MLINLTSAVKNFHGVDLKGILGIGVGRRKEIGWGRRLIGNVKGRSLAPLLLLKTGMRLINLQFPPTSPTLQALMKVVACIARADPLSHAYI
jgi:hypothetical protein